MYSPQFLIGAGERRAALQRRIVYIACGKRADWDQWSSLFPNDSARFGAFSGRLGAVFHVGGGFDISGKYTRGFRAPNTTDLGILGLVGTGFEVDSQTAASRGGFIGTTAGGDAVSTGIPVTRLRPEISDSFDLTLRYTNSRLSASVTGFTNKLKDVYFDQALILPQGAVGTFLGTEMITFQDPVRGWVSVGLAPTTPVLVRVNSNDARLNGVEADFQARINKQFTANGNFTYIRAYSLLNGLPPNIEGGIPPATAFLSLRYQPRSRFYVEAYSALAGRQNRLSTLDLGDRRTGAARSRTNIQNFFRRGCVCSWLNYSGCGRLHDCGRHSHSHWRNPCAGPEPHLADRLNYQRSVCCEQRHARSALQRCGGLWISWRTWRNQVRRSLGGLC